MYRFISNWPFEIVFFCIYLFILAKHIEPLDMTASIQWLIHWFHLIVGHLFSWNQGNEFWQRISFGLSSTEKFTKKIEYKMKALPDQN